MSEITGSASYELTENGLIKRPDVVLIGGGIMSATLGIMLKKLKPELTIQIVELLSSVAMESSHAWNNAGTGHAALCELNYTPVKENGEVDISKAIEINEEFEMSKQFWAHLVEDGVIEDPAEFIRKVPHMSFVKGAENVEFLKKRHEVMTKHHFFDEMQFSEDHSQIAEWAPLLEMGRDGKDQIAVTRVETGTDIDFGSLTRVLFNHLINLDGVELATDTAVRDLDKEKSGEWEVKVKKVGDFFSEKIYAPFVFIGAGGGSLKLLQKSGVKEGEGFGGFPISGQFLVCKNQGLVEQHRAKVYGKAAVGAPPMSVPHLDTRVIQGKNSLLFGPYAGFSPKFLKRGSMLDLLASVTLDNIGPMLSAGMKNMNLTEYLYQEVINTHADRVDLLRNFFPDAKDDEWDLVTAGQRVQIIKKDKEKGGTLQFGTEVVAAADGSLSALLGASPGASTAVAIILEVLEKCFPEEMTEGSWAESLNAIVPTYGKDLSSNQELYESVRSKIDEALKIGAAKR